MIEVVRSVMRSASERALCWLPGTFARVGKWTRPDSRTGVLQSMGASMNEEQLVRHSFGGREIDPVEAASIHIALEELRDRADSYLEVEVAEDDTASRIEANCRAVASELGLRLRF